MNIFLLGCDTGSGKLLECVAKELKDTFKKSVAVFGVPYEGSAENSESILLHIDDVLTASLNHKTNKSGKIKISDFSLNVAFSTMY